MSSTLLLDPSTDPAYQLAKSRRELLAIEKQLQRRLWASNPEQWAIDRLGVTLWSAQRRVLRSLVDNRKTAVRSCHEIGKSFIAGLAVCWWIDTHRPGEAFVITSAPTGRQVKAILWREVGRAHTAGNLPGRTNLTEMYLPVASGKEELVAFGQKPSDLDPTAFQGIHAKYVLVVFDEACGMPKLLWEAADSLIANDNSRRLDIGNPDDPSAEFAKVCTPGSGWNVVGVGAFDTPNFTGEPMPQAVLDQLIGRTWVEEKRKAWAPTWSWVDADGRPSDPETGVRVIPPPGLKLSDIDPYWSSKVLGVFPSGAALQGLIPPAWIEAAQERKLPINPSDPDVLGIDCGAGGDESTTCHKKGGRFRILSSDRNPDTMQTTGKVVSEIKTTKATLVKIDRIGIGAGIHDRLAEQTAELSKLVGAPVKIEGIHSGSAPHNSEDFQNFRAEAWWRLRSRFESGDVDIDPKAIQLATELASIRYKRTSSGKILIESKDEAKRRGVKSPNEADSMMFAECVPLPPEPTKPEKRGGLLW